MNGTDETDDWRCDFCGEIISPSLYISTNGKCLNCVYETPQEDEQDDSPFCFFEEDDVRCDFYEENQSDVFYEEDDLY